MEISRQPAGDVVHVVRGKRLVKVLKDGETLMVEPFSMGWADKDQAILAESLDQSIIAAEEMANNN